MKLVDWLTISAILLGPIIALRLQTLLERKKEERNRRLRVFRNLMVTRGTILAPLHVEALNSIDIEFNADTKEDKAVRDAWKAYLDHLGPREQPKSPEEQKAANERWNEKTQELLAELLFVMAQAVGYDFDKTYIKRAAYSPVRYGDIEAELDIIRRSMAQVLLGNKTLPIEIRGPIEDSASREVKARRAEEEATSQAKLRELLIEHYEGRKPINVAIVPPEGTIDPAHS